MSFPGGTGGKEPPADAGDIRDVGRLVVPLYFWTLQYS